ncbi:helix-turn-helix transcriptional regulator [Ectothiorhodospira haloalkaliphila]|uniref:helix-turn-helix transcriptional regulator n=1 Tax=Ectothiorhodospira haloalkaliphila TaxID=421628 RepID=UPI001FD5F75D|nr:AlpA family phage regulatory protein [Ectothiorhodospira haloalkaliphila]
MILRIREVTGVLGVSRSTVYDYMDPRSPRHDPTFPRPVRLGRAAVGWIQSEILEWLASRPRG